MLAEAEEFTISEETTSWMFFRSLKASKLLSAPDIERLERRAETEPLALILEALVADGILTEYQLQRLKDGEARGMVLGQYRILAELGKGGCGQVFKARHTLMDRVVAIKLVSPELCQHTARMLFLREVVASTKLSHPNIAAAYDADESDGHVYFVMEYVNGTTLQAHVETNGPVSHVLACTVLGQTARGLQHAHEHGLVHRDVKPANIMLTTEGTQPLHVKIVDFGLARVNSGANRSQTTLPVDDGVVVGTPAFIAPEQVKNVHMADIRSDLYSLGCVAYFMMTGRPPFEGQTPALTTLMHLNSEPTPLLELRSDVPAPLVEIIHRLMAKNPDDRFQSPEDVVEALNEFVLTGAFAPAEAVRAEAPQERMSMTIGDSEPPLAEELASEAPAVEVERMQALWLDWCRAVGGAISKRPEQMSEAEYRSIYRELLVALRGVRRSENAPPEAVLDRMISHVEPWVTLLAIERLDPRTRFALGRECRTLNAALRPVVPAAQRSNWFFPVACLVLALLAFAAMKNWPQWSASIRRVTQLPSGSVAAVVLLVPVLLLVGAVALRTRRQA